MTLSRAQESALAASYAADRFRHPDRHPSSGRVGFAPRHPGRGRSSSALGGLPRAQPVAHLVAAAINRKRLLALWNTLPGVDKRRKVGIRETMIDELWAAIEMLPDPEPQSEARRPSKRDEVIAMLRRPEGVTVDEVASVTGWQRHTVRGVFSGTLKKRLGLTLASAEEDRGRVYRIVEGGA